MYEKFGEATRRAEQAGRDFATARGDPLTHTGHLLYGIFVTGANNEMPSLSAIPDGAARIAATLADPLPEGLMRLRKRGASFSEAYLSGLEQAIRYTQTRGSESISLSDLLRAILDTEPNVATHLLKLLAVDRHTLDQELGRDSRPPEA
jgi:hypothetical protein